jgi:D-aspartate ligase
MAPIDTSTPAVVLKLVPNVMHHGGLGAIRSLGRIGVPVYGVHEGPWAPVASSRYLAGRFFWQPSPADVDRVLTGLLRLAKHIDRPSVLITTDDVDPPKDLPRRLAGKYSLYQLCRELDLPCPEVTTPDSLIAAQEFAAAVGYPLIAKLSTPWSTGSELPSTSVVTDHQELGHIYRRCTEFGAELMLQEFIPGGSGHDWFFHGYCNAASVCEPAFTGIKERSYPVGAGGTTLGRSTANEKLRDEITSMLARLGYRGILDLDIRLDARDGQYNLLDFNPRLGAQFRVFRDTAGTDVVLAAYLDLTGQAIPQGEQVSGRGFLVESYDPLGALDSWRSGQLSPRSWLSSLRTVDEAAWFAFDDLRPFGLMCLRMGWKLATRRFSSGRKHDPLPTFHYRAGRAASRASRALVMPTAAAQPQREETP